MNNTFVYSVIEIKTISGQKKRIVNLSNEIKLGLYQGEIKKLGLKEGCNIDDELLSKIYKLLYERARRYSFNLLAKKDYSAKSLRDNLVSKSYPSYVVDEVIDYLLEKKYINDERIIDNLIESYKKKYGIYAIKDKLYKKGFDIDLIEEKLENLYSDNVDDLITRVAEKKLSTLKKDDERKKEKLYRYLVYKGFTYDEISEFMSKYF